MHIFTIDLEEWFHINDSLLFDIRKWPSLECRLMTGTSVILKFLEHHDIKATFFIVGWIAHIYPGLVMKISEAGHQIGYHSWRHLRPFRQSTREYIKDLQEGRLVIELLTNKKVQAYRAPNFSLDRNTEWVYRCLIDNGITLSSSIKQGTKLGKVKVPGRPFIVRTLRGQLVEFPLNQYYGTTFTGSGYFRICPWLLLRHIYSKPDYTMSYFHPRDFDIDFNKLYELGFFRNWMHSVGNSSTLPKLECLTTYKDFYSIEEAMKHVNLDQLDVIELI